MFRLRKLFISLALVLAICAPSLACDECKTKVENYAHPTMLMGQTQRILGATPGSTYVVGGKVVKPKKDRLFVKNKKQVVVSTWAESVLEILKNNQNPSIFDPKAPVLRSELAVILAEGFNLPQNTEYKVTYSDIKEDYWAKKWIYKALDTGVMIGYPSSVFKPDQPVTKAEVFATIAKIIDVKYANTNSAPVFEGKKIQYIPFWANPATKEVVASGILANIQHRDKVVSAEYLSKEQVAYLVSELRNNLYVYKNIKLSAEAQRQLRTAAPISIKVKLEDRISAKHSNVGERFRAKTTETAIVKGVEFTQGATVTGEVVAVGRPGYKNHGYVKVKFLNIKQDEKEIAFPKEISEIEATALKNPNIIARILGAPFTGSARVVGVAGRAVGAETTMLANRTEEFGDYIGKTFVELASLKPAASARSFGNSLLTIGKGTVDTVWLALSGTYGVLYEIGDEIVYVVLPSLTNDAALNPNEELTIIF